VLKLLNCAVRYASCVAALEPTSLTFVPGEFVVLLGHSGAGKTTLLRTMNGLVQPSQGDVLGANGRSIFASPAALRRHRRATAMIFQQHHLIGRLSAMANVLIGRLGGEPAWRVLYPPSREDRELALAALDRVDLIARALVRADRLSGGEQQRVGVARALAQQPRVILADEPVASLDPASGERLLGDLRRICEEDGLTVVVSLHQPELAQRFADRIIGLAQGRVVFDGAARALARGDLERLYHTSKEAKAAA
jgi:phosphonate transport system ATP-binding protein